MNPNRIGAVLLATGLLLTLTLTALADHPATSDGGFDLAWSEPMNQESFWESYFGDGYDCTKFSNHSGAIPASYEAAVVKSGSDFVRVYTDPPAQVLGPPNPNAQHPNKRHEAPFSWVMKCDHTETTTTTNGETTTSADTTTTTSTTTPTSSTTTTSMGTTVTTGPSETTTSTLPAPTTTAPTDDSTVPPRAPVTSPSPTPTPLPSLVVDDTKRTPSGEELPFTGPEHLVVGLLLATTMVGGGWRLIRGRWGR